MTGYSISQSVVPDQATSISPENVLEKQILRPPSQNHWIEILVKDQQVYFTKAFRGFWYTQRLENP